MDKAFLKEHNLLDERNRMAQLMEMITPGYIDEAEGEEEMPDMGGDPGAMGGDPNAMGGDPNAAPQMGGDPNAMGGDPNAMPAGPEGEELSTGLAPAADDMGAAPMEAPEEDVEEINVDDLTDAQESTEHKVDKLSQSIKGLIGNLSDIISKIDANSENVENLRKEIEKRNPTPEEKANQQVNVSAPFNVRPSEFEPAIAPEVSATPEPQYQIKKSDINGFNNWSEYARSLSNQSNPYTLKDYLNF